MDGPDEAEARAAVARIARWRGLENKEIPRRLLRYLADRTLEGTAGALKEYTVGVECFAKPEGYDPQTDSSVRVHLGKLRKLLEEYAEGDGRDEALRVVLPMRQFALEFQPRAAVAPPPATLPRRQWWGVAAAGLTGIGAGWWLGRPPAPDLTPALREFWQPSGSSALRSVVCLGTPLFLRYRGAFVRLPGQEDFETLAHGELAQALGRVLQDAEPVAGHEYTGAGEGSGAFLIAQTLARGGVFPEIRRSHLLSWEEIKNENVIFLGSAKYIPQLKQLPDQPEFLADRMGVLNPRPKPGEPDVFKGRRGSDRDLLEHHAVISRIWGPERRGRLWLIGGSSTGATLAAVEAICSERKLAEILARVREGKPGLPESFEVVVKAQFRQEVAVSVQYVTHRSR